MKDGDQIPTLNAKIQLLNDNLNRVYEFFVEKSAQNSHDLRLIEAEQFLIQSLLDRWKSLPNEETAPTPAPSARPNGETSFEVAATPNQSSQAPQGRERYANHRATLSIAKEPVPVLVPAGGSSPGRSPKGKESYTAFRKQTGTSSPTKNSPYPVLPKKRKLPILFSPTTPSPLPTASVVLNEIVFPFTLPATASVSANLEEIEIPQAQAWPSVQSRATDSGSLEPQMYENGNMDTEENSAYSEKSTPARKEVLVEKSTQVTKKMLVEKSTQVTKEVLESYIRLSSRSVEVEVGEGSQQVKRNEVEEPEKLDAEVVLKPDEPPELETRPPILSPITPSTRRTPSSSPRRQPTQGFRKSSRTIRPSWKLNKSTNILSDSSPERTSKEDNVSPERTGKKDKVNPERTAKKDKSTPERKAKEDNVVKSEKSAMSISTRRKMRLRAQLLSEQPPVLTSQVEIPLVKLSLGSTSTAVGRRLTCNECGKTFTTPHGLRYHLESHLQLKPFKCNVCLKSFGRKSSLNRHLATTHTKAKAHICSICKKCFSSHSELNSHRGRHGAKRNFCNVCHRSFLDKRYFKLHQKLCIANGNSNSTVEAGSLFQCSKCQKSYRDPHYYKKHISLCSTN